MLRRLFPALALLAGLGRPGLPQQEPPEPPFIAEQDPLPPQEEKKKIHLPPGFELQLVACEPEIGKPINLAFDDHGRLLVTVSYEYPIPAKEGVPARDMVKVLEDFAPDGRARKISTYVSGLNIPLGVVPTQDGVICYSIPKVWRFTDEGGSGKAEKREPLYGDIGTRDTHGMTNSFTPWIDGWIYACHGFSNHSELRPALGGPGIVMDSGNTYRMRPDGTKIEYYTHGQVNPFGLCFDPLGNLYSADCHSKPIYQLLRGAWYESFGGQHDGLGLGPLMMTHLHGSTAIGGIVYYAATQFPEAHQGTVFVGNPVTGCVNQDRLEKHGSSWKAVAMPNFIRSDDRWFRPVDLKLAPDGSIYMADFYNRIIGHYEVPLTHPGRDRERGRIWRIVYTGEGATPPRPMPDLFTLSSEGLIALLKDDNLQVRVRATNHLIDRIGQAAVEPTKAAMVANSPATRAHGLWVLERLGALDEALVRTLAADGASLVRVHLLKALGERTNWTFEPALVLAKLADADPFVRRAAAEALGLHPDPDGVKALLGLWSATPADDTHLVHTVRMAIRDHLKRPGTYGALSGFDRDSLRRIANVTPGVRTEESAAFAFQWLRDEGPDASLLRYAARYLKADLLPALFEHAKTLESRPIREQMPFIRAVQQSCQERGMAPPATFRGWAEKASIAGLESGDKTMVQDALKLCREFKLSGAFEPMLRVALDPKAPTEARAGAFDCLPALDPARGLVAIARVTAASEESTAIRLKSAAVLGAQNTPEARVEILKLLQAVPHAIAVQIAIGMAGSREGGGALLGAIDQGKASPRLLADRAVEGRFRATNVRELLDRREKIMKDLPPEDERVLQLIKARQKGFAAAKPDPAHGAEVYQKTCAGCHKIDGKGQKVGPELDAVYTRGVERLLEDILDPNRNVDQAFRATLIKTKDGRVISGLVMREEGEVVVIQEAADKETRLSKADIEQRVLSQLSPMPTNVVEPLSEPDFYDLLAFLLQPRGQK